MTHKCLLYKTRLSLFLNIIIIFISIKHKTTQVYVFPRDTHILTLTLYIYIKAVYNGLLERIRQLGLTVCANKRHLCAITITCLLLIGSVVTVYSMFSSYDRALISFL